MKVRISMNRMGHLTLSPVSREIARRLRRYLDSASAHDRGPAPNNSDAWVTPTVYLQLDTDVESFLSDLPASVSRDLKEGWDRVVSMDPHTFGSYCGYDAGDNYKQWHDRKKKYKRPTYTLELTADEASAVEFARGRYEWATALAKRCEGTDEEAPATIRYSGHEADWWSVREAVEADTEGNHAPYPLASGDLARKIQAFLDQFV